MFVLALLGAPHSAGKESLYIFLPTEVRPKVLQDKLSQACPNLKITAFGRIKDFKVYRPGAAHRHSDYYTRIEAV